jgi:hypothetical protein
MSDRTAEQVRQEIAAERLALQGDVDGLKKELRSFLPFVIAGFVMVALAAVGVVIGIRKLRNRQRARRD